MADKNPRIAGPRMGGNSSAVLESVTCRWASVCGRAGRDSTTAGHALQRSRPASNADLYPERRPPKAARTPAYLLPAVRFGCQWVHQLPGLPQGRGRRDSPSGSGRRFCGKGQPRPAPRGPSVSRVAPAPRVLCRARRFWAVSGPGPLSSHLRPQGERSAGTETTTRGPRTGPGESAAGVTRETGVGRAAGGASRDECPEPCDT